MIRSSVLAFVCLAVLGTPLVAASAECYGPVGRDDTLWLIALRLRPDPSITPQRMMLALLEANPGAFGRDNVNALYAGSTLCLGPRDSIKTDELAAIAEVRRHNREWKSGRAPVDAGSHDPAPTPERPPAAGPGRDREQRGSLRLDHAVAAFDSRLVQVEDRIEHLESGSRTAGAGPGPMQVAEELARLAKRVARIEGRIRVLAASLETESEAETAEHGAMEPMPTPAPQSHGAMEPMPTPAPQSHGAMEPMPTPAPQSHGAMEPMPTPAPQSHGAMEPMPTPAPQSHGAMEPMPTPAPQSHGAMEPMPTPAPQSHGAMEPMPTPAPQSHGAMEPMPTPAPQSHGAMEPMPTPAPQSHEAMEPMPTPAPQSHGAMEPMPTPAPQNREAAGPEPEPVPEDRDSDEDLSTEESVSARVATWLERVRELLKR